VTGNRIAVQFEFDTINRKRCFQATALRSVSAG
jgi:hypothetical protein